MPSITIDNDTTLDFQLYGQDEAEPLLLLSPTAQSRLAWDALAQALAGEGYKVICYDHRGLGGSSRGSAEISTASLAADAIPLLDALGIERAHVLGWSLGSAVAQELAIAHPERVGAVVLYATWAHADMFQRAIFTALRNMWATQEMQDILTAMAIVFSPELINSPSFPELVAAVLPAMPQTQAQVAATVEQWDADLLHDTRERLGGVASPTLVIGGEQDLLTPAWQCRAVADMIPEARIEILTGPGSSHALAFERADEFVPLLLGFLREHSLPKTARATA